MADVVIREIEMPKSCDICPFVGTNDDLMSDDYRYLYCGFPYMGQYVTDYEASRHPNCPLGSLPAGHGRLIDADALIRDKSGEATLWCGYEYQDHSVVFEEDIRNAPTIVPAEGGGEE